MMFNRVMRNSAMAVGLMLAFFTGVLGCEKDEAPATSDKGYLVDGGGSAEIPDDSDPCLAKGAAGAMGLLLKADCEKIKPAECGNYLPEDGEQCDPPDGKVCDIKCQKIEPGITGSGSGGGGNSTGVTLSFKPTALPDRPIGAPYDETIEAVGKAKTDSYMWSVNLSSNKFIYETTPTGVAIKIKSVDAAEFGSYSADVKVCLKSDASVCAEKKFDFKIVDQLTLTAYLVTEFMSTQKSGPFCTSSSSCGNLLFDANTLLNPSAILNTSTKDDHQAILGLLVEGLTETASGYTWSFTYKVGSELKQGVNYKAGSQLLPPSGIYLLEETAPVKKGSFRWLTIGPDAYGKTYKDVVITVKNNLGGEQKLTFPEIKIDTKENIAKVLKDNADSKKDDDDDYEELCNNMAVTSITITDDNTYDKSFTPQKSQTLDGKKFFHIDVDDLSVDKVYSATITMSGGQKPYKMELHGFTTKYNKSAFMSGNPTVDAGGIAWPKFDAVQPGMEDWIDIKISDDPDAQVEINNKKYQPCPQTVFARIVRTFPNYPPVSEESLANIKSVYANIYFSNVDSHTFFNIQLLDKNGNALAQTGNIKNGQWEGEDSSITKPLTMMEGVSSDTKIGDVAQVKLYLNDSDYGWPDMAAGVKEIKFESKYWSWSLYEGTCKVNKDCIKNSAGDFAKCKSGGCSNLEVDGNYESWLYDISQFNLKPLPSVINDK